MDDREFFDLLYQQWAKTTGAKDTYWMSEPQVVEDDYNDLFGLKEYWDVIAVGEESGERKWIASFPREEDADFTTAVHGCFGDLVRRLHSALDEADRADHERDARECRIAELEMENDELRERLAALEPDKADIDRWDAKEAP